MSSGNASPARPPGGRRLGSLSRSLPLSAVAAASGELDPSLRAALAHAHTQHPQQPLSFAARAALDPASPQASLELFKRLRRGQAGGATDAGPSKAEPADAAGPPPLSRRLLSDSARQTETEGGTPTSQRSLLESADEGPWGSAQQDQAQAQDQQQPAGADAAAFEAPPEAAQRLQREPSLRAAAEAAAGVSPFAAAATEAAVHQALQPSASGPAEPPSTLRPDLLAQLEALHSAPAAPAAGPPVAQAQHGSGGDTPRSAVSWASMGSATPHSLPQTAVELQGLSQSELQRLAAEAAEVQARAATALRLARQRLEASAGDAQQPPSTAASTQQPAALQPGAAPAAVEQPAAPVGAVPVAAPPAATLRSQPAPSRLLQLYILLMAVAEVALLWGSGLVQRASGGRVAVPRSLALLPLTATRFAVLALLLAADLAAAALALLRGRRPALYI